MDVRYHRLSAKEYQEARAWYERRRTGLGHEFLTEVDRAVDKIISHPNRWPVFREKYHKVRLRRFPYALYYRVLGPDLAIVLAVAHDRRRPGYWLRRGAN